MLAIAAGVALVLLLTSAGVGYFGDELYFPAAGHHRDWGHADQGPPVPLLSRAMDSVMPGAYSAHRGYWHFGAPSNDARTVLFVGSDPALLGRLFTEVHQVATVTTGPLMNLFAQPTPVWLCSGQHAPWSRLWPQLCHL